MRPGQIAARRLAAVLGYVPVFHPQLMTVQRAVEGGNVPRNVDIGRAALQILVHVHATLGHLQARLLGQGGVGSCAHSGEDEISVQRPPALSDDPQRRAIGLDGAGGILIDNLDAVLL